MRQLCESLGDQPHLAESFLQMGTIFTRTGRFSEADVSLARAHVISSSLDYKAAHLSCSLRRATLRYYLGDEQEAERLARELLAEARQAERIPEQIAVLSLLTRLTGETDYAARAAQLAETHHLQRELTAARFATLEALLRREQCQEADREAADLWPIPLAMNEDIELPWMCNQLAELAIARREVEKAATYLDRSHRAAEQSGLRAEMVGALTLRGQVAFDRGDYERSYADYRQALAICRNMSETITEESDRKRFQSTRAITFLTGQIKRLGELMAIKERAGTATRPSPTK
jgi:tetratricopeptide (TPR) repeat protein